MELIDRVADSDLRPLLHRRSSWSFTSLFVLPLLLAGSCASGAWLWANLEQFVETAEIHGDASRTNPLSEDRALLLEIKWWQQKADDEILELGRRINALREDLKGIQHGITMLAPRTESLQSVTPQLSVAPTPPPPPGRAFSGIARKRFGQSKPEGPVSVGGAPVVLGPNKAGP
ncbi:hypothetical protein [Bradyrhizobium sp. SBR1B]|uniref:hypothetical protein n=1 Tax=Bradyrhizobium sp. SBR1B TaxID=2663836 RepID=UPI0016063E85|nr:hypothetical protein [Bradyrhizobium sp. SBR1B]MBB4380279.1 hypothetical protein [Bradyrhizobium sp. SBR1B]